MGINIYVYIALALLLGLVSSKVVDKIKLPHVTGYLVIGLLAGPSFLGLISNNIIDQFYIVSDMALGFIAFSIGSEFKLDYLKRIGKSPIVIAIFEALGGAILITVSLILLGYDLSFALLLGAIASATAPAATLMVIRQYRAKGPVTFTLLPVVALDDAVAIIAFGLAGAAVKILNSPGSTSLIASLKAPTIEIIGGIIFGAILGVILTHLTNWFKGKGNLLSIVIAIIAFNIGISNIAGFSSLLSCMAMSAVYVNLSEISKEVFNLTETITPPLFMLFFFLSGADLDISLIPTVGAIGVVYLLVRVVGKVAGAALGAHISGAQPVVKKYLGFTLIPQAGVAIALSSMAMNILPAFGREIRAIILFATIIYELTGPVITKIALTKAGEIQTEKVKQKKTQPKAV